MHRQFSLPKSNRSSKVAVLDTIHGADVIAEGMRSRGLNAKAMEVYHHHPYISDFDLIVSPVHLWPENPVLKEARRLKKKVITHHQAVGELLADETGFQVFEITGTHSKTSTALVLSSILSREKKVISHTTRGIELWEKGSNKVLKTGLSITPGNQILAFEIAHFLKVDALISEISLGGTGLADYGILTSFYEDYKIAGDSKWASAAKLQMVSLAKPGAKLIANVDTNTFPDISFGQVGQVRCTANHIYVGKKKLSLSLGDNFDSQSYLTALSAAVATSIAAGIKYEEIIAALEGFDGLSGRMKRSTEKDLIIYDNSNSGIKVSGVEWGLDYAQGDGKLGLVVGEESETVCEGMDIPMLVELLKRRRQEIDHLVLVGERLKPFTTELQATFAPDLPTGQNMAKMALGRGDRLLSCVKCFR